MDSTLRASKQIVLGQLHVESNGKRVEHPRLLPDMFIKWVTTLKPKTTRLLTHLSSMHM